MATRYSPPVWGLATVNSEKIGSAPTFVRRKFCFRANCFRRAICHCSSDISGGLRRRETLAPLNGPFDGLRFVPLRAAGAASTDIRAFAILHTFLCPHSSSLNRQRQRIYYTVQEDGIGTRNEDQGERRMRRPRVFAAVLLSLALLGFSCASFGKSEDFLPARAAGAVQSDLITEASGIVAGRRSPGVLWVHNDSGDAPRIYAIDEKANLLGICNIKRAQSATGKTSPSARVPTRTSPTCTSAISGTTPPSIPKSLSIGCRSRKWTPVNPSAR